MPSPSVPPPLRVKNATGSPNIIPAFVLTVSNGTVAKGGAGEVIIGMGTGAAGAPGASGGMAIGSGVAGGVAGAVLFVDSNTQLAQDPSQLFWDNANNRLGVGGSTPGVTLDVVGSGRASSVFILGTQATSGGHAVRADRLYTTTVPLAGGGDHTADRTLTVDTAFLANTGSVFFTTKFPLSGGNVVGLARSLAIDTAFLVTSGRQVLAGVALAGGGNLGADVTLNLQTGAAGQYAVTSVGFGIQWITTAAAGSSVVYAATGNDYLTASAAADLTAERILGVVSALYTDTGTAARFLIGLSTGTTGQMLITSAGVAGSAIWVNTLGGASGAVYAATGNEYLTASAAADLTAERILGAVSSLFIDTATAGRCFVGLSIGAVGQVLISSASAAGSALWINTANIARTTTVTIPLAPMTVSNANANAFWASSAMTNFNIGYMAFSDGVTGIVTYYGEVPTNLASVPQWNLYAHCMPAVGAGGSGAFLLKAKTFGHNTNFDQALTTIVSTLSYPVVATGTMSTITFSTNSFDGVEALTAGNLLIVEFQRVAGNAGDGINQQLNVFSLYAQAQVIT